MNITTIEMDPDEARASLRTYRRHLHRRADKEYEAVAAGLEAMAGGYSVISLQAAIRGGGFDERMRPKLAIARADRLRVRFAWRPFENVCTFDAGARTGPRGGDTMIRRVDLGLPHRQRYAGGSAMHIGAWALVPMIPPQVRDEAGVLAYRDRDHFLLWEVDEWHEEPARAFPPVDPLLLRHLGGDAYAVLAAWDLTPLERLAMAGRADA